MSALAPWLAAVLLLAGCATHLVPAPGTHPAPGRGRGAMTEVNGVLIAVHADAWTGRPLSLGQIVTPILATVDNRGPVPIRIRREQVVLVRDDGTRLAARGPYEIQGTATDVAPAGLAYPRPSFGFGFGVYRGWGFGYDPFFYDDYYYPMHVQIPLPTADMVQMALPEGAVEPGGRISGFLYFERVTREAKRVELTARPVDARTGEPVATIVIPFLVE